MGRIKKQNHIPRRNRSSIAMQIRSRTSSPAPQQVHRASSRKHKGRLHYKHKSRGIQPLRDADRRQLAEIAQETMNIIHGEGSYTDAESGLTHNIVNQIASSVAKTCIYAANSSLIDINGPRLLSLPSGKHTQVQILQTSPLRAARDLLQSLETSRDGGGIGFLSCCSAKRPGGGFLNGGTEKEECLARASTIYASLTSEVAAPFYRAHKHDDAAGFYDHQLIYTPQVVVLRADRRLSDVVETGGGPFIPPFHISVVSSCPINAAQLRGLYQHNMPRKEMNQGIETVMRSRMAHILRVFEERSIKNLILNAYGVGQPFFNNVETVARIWADLIACPDSVFKRVFDRVWFALDVTDFGRFKNSFDCRVLEEELNLALATDDTDADDLEQVDSLS